MFITILFLAFFLLIRMISVWRIILFKKSNQLLTIYLNTFISEIYNRIKIVNLEDIEIFDLFLSNGPHISTRPARMVDQYLKPPLGWTSE